MEIDDAKIWIIKNQFARRNISNYTRAELVLHLKPLLAEKAKERMLARKFAEIHYGYHQNHGRTTT